MGNRGHYGFSSNNSLQADFYGFSKTKTENQPSAYPLLCWYKANVLSGADGDVVSSWTDSSGLGAHAVQATLANQPKFYNALKNGLPIVRFDNSNDFLSPPVSSIGGSYTVVCAFNQTAIGTNHYMFDSRQTTVGANRLCVMLGDSAGGAYGYVYGTNITIRGSYPTSLGWTILSWVFDGVAESARIYKNFAYIMENAFVSQPLCSNYTSLGTAYTAIAPLGADMGEFMIFNMALPIIDLQSIIVYLNRKWAIF